MDKDWRNMMDVGLVHFMAFPIIKDEGPIIESAQQIASDDFFDVLEVRRSDRPEVTAGLKRVADESGILLGVGGQPGLLLGGLSLNDPDDAARRAAIDEVKKSIDFAADVGSPMVAILSGPDPGDAERENQIQLLVDSLVELCEYGQDKGADKPIWISLEQFDHKYDKKCLVGP
ncbi:MAG: TIM barrel protein, partial [Armatimonadota bacterium]